MRKLLQFLSNHLEVIVTVFLVFCIFFFVDQKQDFVNKNGVITIAKVIKYEATESGSDLYIDIYLNEKIYSTTLGYGGDSKSIGKFYFIKVNKTKPTDYPLLYSDKEVPSCILEKTQKYDGWEDFPTCIDK